MNILIANDDGPDAEGLDVLRTATKAAYPNATIVIISPKHPMGGQGLSVTPRLLDDFLVEKIAARFYLCDGKPADLIYLALGQPERFLQKGTFDLVLTGINHGENIGMDVFHSGTVGMAMLASTFFGTAAVAFSHQIDEPMFEILPSKGNIDFITSFLKSEAKSETKCWNVNFPAKPPIGWKICSVARHSRFRPFRAEERKHLGCDVTELERGFISLSPLCLSVVPPLIHPLNTSVDSVCRAREFDITCLNGFENGVCSGSASLAMKDSNGGSPHE